MKDEFCAFVCGLVAGLVVAILFSWVEPLNSAARETAVKAGHAEYYLDAKHDKQWRWRDCCKPEEIIPMP